MDAGDADGTDHFFLCRKTLICDGSSLKHQKWSSEFFFNFFLAAIISRDSFELLPYLHCLCSITRKGGAGNDSSCFSFLLLWADVWAWGMKPCISLGVINWMLIAEGVICINRLEGTERPRMPSPAVGHGSTATTRGGRWRNWGNGQDQTLCWQGHRCAQSRAPHLRRSCFGGIVIRVI